MFERGKLFVVVSFFRISLFGFGAKSGMSKRSLKEVTVNDFIVSNLFCCLKFAYI